jgi:hypothetical protein
MLPRRIVAILTLALPLGIPTITASQEPAAVVSRYLPTKADHFIERADGTTAVVALGAPLFAGDSVVVLPGGSVVLAYSDGDTEELSGATSFTVPAREPMGLVAQMFGRLQTVLGRQYRQGANLATRGDSDCGGEDAAVLPLAVPALQPIAYLGPGHDDLSLAWVGGCGPYSLSISGHPGQRFSADGLLRPQARLATAGLATGEYRLSVRDASGQEYASRLVVHEGLPAGPFANDVDSNELTAVAYAAWLAGHEDGRWRWESFQVLRPWIRRGSALAGTYGDLLLWGDPHLAEIDGD